MSGFRDSRLAALKAKIAALEAQRVARARQDADAEAARQRDAERQARCAGQQGALNRLTRDADCR